MLVQQVGRGRSPTAALLPAPLLTEHFHTDARQGEKHSETQRCALTNFSSRVPKSPKHTCLANPQFVILKKKMMMMAKKGEFTIHKPICVVSATLQKCDS